MVRQDRTRCHRAWRLYLSCGPEAKAHAIHPPVQQATQAREVEVLRHSAPNYSRINRYSPLVPRCLEIRSELSRRSRSDNHLADSSTEGYCHECVVMTRNFERGAGNETIRGHRSAFQQQYGCDHRRARPGGAAEEICQRSTADLAGIGELQRAPARGGGRVDLQLVLAGRWV